MGDAAPSLAQGAGVPKLPRYAPGERQSAAPGAAVPRSPASGVRAGEEWLGFFDAETFFL